MNDTPRISNHPANVYGRKTQKRCVWLVCGPCTRYKAMGWGLLWNAEIIGTVIVFYVIFSFYKGCNQDDKEENDWYSSALRKQDHFLDDVNFWLIVFPIQPLCALLLVGNNLRHFNNEGCFEGKYFLNEVFDTIWSDHRRVP